MGDVNRASMDREEAPRSVHRATTVQAHWSCQWCRVLTFSEPGKELTQYDWLRFYHLLARLRLQSPSFLVVSRKGS